MLISTINFELCHLVDCTFVIAKNLRRVIQDCKIRSLPAHVINLYYTTIYAWRSVYSYRSRNSSLVKCFRSGCNYWQTRPALSLSTKSGACRIRSLSRLHLQTLHESVIVSLSESLAESALRVRSVYNSI